MKKILAFIILNLFRFALWFRYRVTVKGLENLNEKTLQKPGGILFLPNHPTVFVDPTLIALAILKKFPIRPIIVEYMYYMPIVHFLMKLMKAIPIPNFVTSSNSLKKRKADKVVETLTQDLRNGDHFLIYPAGRVKFQACEVVNGSAVPKIIQSVPEANIVLVRIIGLWGSSFSRALTGQPVPMFKTIFHGFKKTLKNFLFFTPRREVTIEFSLAGSDFPIRGSRVEINRYLEKWYNRPDGLIPTQEEEPGDSLYLVSYSMWGPDFPTIKAVEYKEGAIDISKISEEIQKKVKAKLSEMTQSPIDQILPDMQLGADLGLDSLDNADLIAFLDEDYDVTGVPTGELTTVGKLMALAAKQVAFGEKIEEELEDISRWNQKRPSRKIEIPRGDTIPEIFLNICNQMKGAIACGDMRAGILSYRELKVRALLLAEYIRHLPGTYIGILLPSSVAAYLTVLACQLAGKIPLMINWTIGPRHLEAVRQLTGVEVVLSSWAFLDRLENVDLTGIEDLIVMLEDIRRKIGWKEKLKAYVRSKKGTSALLKEFQIQNMKKDAKAVLLFTSGTESMPKGVPLTHENIISNQRAALQEVDLKKDDILLGILPPFHVFGFSISGLLPLLAGIKVAYYPDPTDGKGLAKAVEKWQATIIAGAPTFLKGMFKNARFDELQTLRLCVTGAEKAPPELFEMVKKLDHAHLIEAYGITECSPGLTINMEGDPKKGVGQPISGVELCIVDLDSHQPLPIGQSGLILARGPNIFSGYINPGLARPFIEVEGKEWYSTGDLGYLDSSRNLILSGRLKRFIKIGAEMVSLTAIEEALLEKIKRETGQVEDGPILAICAKEEAGEKPKIFLFTRVPISTEEANKGLREAGFSNLVKISKVKYLPEIPLMGSGKVNYRLLEGQLPALNSLENNKVTIP